MRSLEHCLVFSGAGAYPNLKENSLITNPEVYISILAVLRYCSNSDQCDVLDRLSMFASGAHALENCSKCDEVSPPLIVQLIDLVPYLKSEQAQLAAVYAIQNLGARIMTVPQLKAILRCFKRITDDQKTNTHFSLINA